MGIRIFLERVMQALCESREREAERVVSRYGHFLAQAEEYERSRAIASARRAADAKTIADAKATIAQSGMQFAPWSAP
jgi:ATPase subunit of ABC transporter with duplicated ATPase domains